MVIKRFFQVFFLLPIMFFLSACAINPATGQQQFTALMSPQQEVQIGAQEHEKIVKEYGLYQDQKIQSYVQSVGQKVVKGTERPDVLYRFFVLDSPVVNAFALPGGYIYTTRGLLALANSESEMAAVLAHEAGHITGRHAAERYSRGVVTSLGAVILSSAVGSSGVTRALGVGSDLYMKSYSRGQESQADSLGLRYLSRAGYHPSGMSGFLQSMSGHAALDAMIAGERAGGGGRFFSTHPDTQERVSASIAEGVNYPQQGIVNRNEYLRILEGLVYGDSAAQGFSRGENFYHPKIGFTFSVPAGYRLMNQPSQVIAVAKGGGIAIFDLVPNRQNLSPEAFLREAWMRGEPVSGLENIEINGMRGTTAEFQGSVNGKAMTIRLMAIEWGNGQMARFQIGIPEQATDADIQALKRMTYSFRKLGETEKHALRPYRIALVTASAGDRVESLARRMVYRDHQEERFRVLNGLGDAEPIKAGQIYKIVVE